MHVCMQTTKKREGVLCDVCVCVWRVGRPSGSEGCVDSVLGCMSGVGQTKKEDKHRTVGDEQRSLFSPASSFSPNFSPSLLCPNLT
mmetsp:Transcript_50070/g.128886  ORF Transcript_50070/g.128886 Transcript_50070/m.128886 type:complete len:86 (-) Transcript_50070:195-452(-)